MGREVMIRDTPTINTPNHHAPIQSTSSGERSENPKSVTLISNQVIEKIKCLKNKC